MLRNYEIGVFIEKAITYEYDDCLIWPFALNSWGYAQIGRKEYEDRLVSRIVCKKVNGPPPTDAHQVAHSKRCVSKACINQKHLRWATPKENIADDHRGEDCSYAKLTEEQALEIRRLYATGNYTQKELAEIYGISQRQVCDIINYKRWAWLEDPSDAELIFATTKPRMKDSFA